VAVEKPRYLVGLDLGKLRDYTAMTVTERLPAAEEGQEPQYNVRHIKRFPLGTDYVDIAGDVRTIMQRPPLDEGGELVVDAGGPGVPVIDLLRRMGLQLVSVSITGGEAVTRASRHEWHVPKQDLCTTVRLLMERDQLHVSNAFPEASVLQSELKGFQMKRTPSSNLTFNAREGEHDDLVLCLAIALWWGERPKGVFFA